MRTFFHIVVVAGLVAGCGRGRDEPAGIAAVVQACTAKKDLACPRPIVTVAKLDASIRYYRDKLGFKFDWTDGDPPDFASVTRGDLNIFMCERCQGHPGGWLWVATPDVDKMYAELVKRGAIIKAKPENKPWGSREMQVADPDGNVIRIAGPHR